jgi:phosphoribosylformylglycinamidine synthase II
MAIRIVVYPREDKLNASLLQNAYALGLNGIVAIRTRNIYFLSEHPGSETVERISSALLADPVTEIARWWDLSQEDLPTGEGMQVVEVAFRPGVTDIPARELEKGMGELGFTTLRAATGTRYEIEGDVSHEELRRLTRALLCNETVQHFAFGTIPPHFTADAAPDSTVEQVSLEGLNDAELVALSKARLLSLDANEMRAIQAHFAAEGRHATDVELETLAQTWSEHCVHKTFRAKIEFTHLDHDGNILKEEMVEGLLRQYLRAATDELDRPWLRSAFVDNAGIIAFDDQYDLAFKVETHNHPSALEPFGGANTGVGGVVRDILGVSARPIANTDVLCFGPQDLPSSELPEGVLHPRRIAAGVVAGVGDYGNKLGLPTVNGAVLYDKGYIGNPLVYCGCVGLLPQGSHPHASQAGDLIVALGGRTGRDGLHGATFSSAELTQDTAEDSGSAVQIGDPITEKGLIELIEEARNEQLYSAITDCGAGGFSSAVGEMGAELGASVELAQVPLKYSGLRPWEIWLSEAQERMVLAVPPQHLARLEVLCERWGVELCVLGTFTGDQRLSVHYNGTVVADLPMEFLHNGLPRRHMKAVWQEPFDSTPQPQGGRVLLYTRGEVTPGSLNSTLLQMLADPNVASKEEIVRRYDHEIRGGSIVRPFVGPHMDGPSDAAVVKPLGTWEHNKAFVLSNGINPRLGKTDPYRMALSAIDEAVRNAVAVGADPDTLAILDNFCWGNPTYPDRLGSLVRACQGCYDGAMAYRTPFISGKDSLYNEFNGTPIPGTLLISAIGIVPDIHQTLTMNFKQAGNLIYLLGETRNEMGGSLFYEHFSKRGTRFQLQGIVPDMPSDPLTRYRLLHQAIQQGWLAAAHDLSEGGLAVAIAEMCLAGRLGATVSLPSADLDTPTLLFSESNGRLLLEVPPAHANTVEQHFAGVSLAQLGTVTDDDQLIVKNVDTISLDVSLTKILHAWKKVEK